jgi:hypothetical protein
MLFNFFKLFNFVDFLDFFKYRGQNKVYSMNKTNARIGHDFEEEVREILSRNNYVPVKKNQWRTNYSPENDSATKREYDLVMFNTQERQFYIIECKAHRSEHTLVGLDLVVEFERKLANNNGSSAKRMMVTDTDYTSPARKYASENSILLMNGKELAKLDERGSRAGGLAGKIIFSSLDSIASTLIEKYRRS